LKKHNSQIKERTDTHLQNPSNTQHNNNWRRTEEEEGESEGPAKFYKHYILQKKKWWQWDDILHIIKSRISQKKRCKQPSYCNKKK